MNNILLASMSASKIATDDYVGFTFFVGCMAMMAASAFFFFSMNDSSFWSNYIYRSGPLLVHEGLLRNECRITYIL